MSAKNLATVTNELIESYGNTAKNVITAYRVGNERAIALVDQSWAAAVKKTGTRLSAEVRGNALSVQKKVTAAYAKGVEVTSDSADQAVNKAVELAEKGVVQVAANASRFEKATGVKLKPLAVAAVPAAQAVTKVAAQLEVKSSAFATKLAGKKAKVKVATVKAAATKRAVTKKVVRTAKAATAAATTAAAAE